MNVGSSCPEPVDGSADHPCVDARRTRRLPQPTYALEGAIFVTGAAVQWLRDGLEIIGEAAELEPLAQQCDDTGGVYMVPAFTGLGSPWWDPMRGARSSGSPAAPAVRRLARATIEAMAFQTRDVVDR